MGLTNLKLWTKGRFFIFVFSLILINFFPHLAFGEWTEVTSSFNLVRTRPLYDFVAKDTYCDVTLTNISDKTYQAPIRLIIKSITNPQVTVRNADGTTEDGRPYFDYGSLFGADNRAEPNETSSPKQIRFYNPNRLRFDFTTEIRVEVVTPTNQPPFFTSTPLTVAETGVLYSYKPVAQDPEGEAIRYQYVSGPSGMTFLNGALQWIPTLDQVGEHRVEIQAIDSGNASVSQVFTVSVVEHNLKPIITSVPPTFAKTLEEYRYQVVAFDPEGKPLAFSFAEPPPSGMTIDPNTGLIRWVPTTIGTYMVRVVATDHLGATGEQLYKLNVFDRNLNLELLSPAGSYEVLVGQTLRLDLRANIPAIFSVDPIPENASMNQEMFIFTPSQKEIGVHTLTFYAKAADMRVSNIVSIRVIKENNPPQIDPIPPQSVDEGAKLTFILTATDLDGDPLRFSAPGLNLPNAFFDEINHQFFFNPSYGQAGVYNVVFEVSDGTVSTQTIVQITVRAVQPPSVSVLDLVVDPVTNPTLRSSVSITGSVIGQTGPPPAPELPIFITGLNPSSVKQGETREISITGLNTNFSQGTSVADFGEGIKVLSLNILSPNSAVATISVDREASIGTRQLRIISNGREAPSIVGFMVEKGTASISGKIVDSFTGQPLAEARVSINGSDAFVISNANGEFLLSDVPTGQQTLIVSLPNYAVQKLTLGLGINEQIVLDKEIQLRALARPPSFGGTLPRAQTIASVIDRGVSEKGGGYTFEQAMALVSDTIIVVGGEEFGVLDEAGNQLNPKIKGTGLFSLTHEGVTAQARALMQGDTYTLREILFLILQLFRFRVQPSVQEWIVGFQKSVQWAWANPNHPESAMAIVLFNEGTVLSAQPPIITLDTRLNRFQAFLLLTSFMMYHAGVLDQSAEEILRSRGVDVGSIVRAQISMIPVSMNVKYAKMSEKEQIRGWFERFLDSARNFFVDTWSYIKEFFGVPSAFAQIQVIETGPPPISAFGDLTARKTFTSVWRNVMGRGIVDGIEGALISASFQLAVGLMMGAFSAAAGPIGVVAALTNIAALSSAGFFSIMWQKVIYAWFMGLTAASIQPDPAQIAQGGPTIKEGHLIIPIERSESEKALKTGRGPVGLNPEKVRFDYLLYKFNSFDETDYNKGKLVRIPAIPDRGDPRNGQSPPLGRLIFYVPLTILNPGDNFFRVITFQLLGQQKPLIEGASTYSESGQLSKEDFVNKNVGSEEDFRKLDKNQDGMLDDTEFNRQAFAFNPAGDAFEPNPPEVSEVFSGPFADNASQYKFSVIQEHNQIRGVLDEVGEDVAREYADKLKEDGIRLKAIEQQLRQLEREEFFNDQRKSKVMDEFRQKHAISMKEAEIKNKLARLFPGRDFENDGFYKDLLERELGRATALEERRMVNQLANAFENENDLKFTRECLIDSDTNLRQMREMIKAGQTEAMAELHDYVGRTKTNVRVNIEPFPNADRVTIIEEVRDFHKGEVLSTKETTNFVEPGKGGAYALEDIQTRITSNYVKLQTTDLEFEEATTARLNQQKNLFPTEFHEDEVKLRSETYQYAVKRVDAIKAEKMKLGDEMAKIKSNRARLMEQVEEFIKSRPPDAFEPPTYTGLGVAMDVYGEVLSSLSTVGQFFENVMVLSSEFGPCIRVHNPGDIVVPTEQFPPSIALHPDQNLSGAVLRGITDPTSLRKSPSGAMKYYGGFIEWQFPLQDERRLNSEAGFPPAFLTVDRKGRVYAENVNSNEQFGGRIFRYTFVPGQSTQLNSVSYTYPLSREFMGAVKYYSLSLQFGHPTFPVAMVVGPPFSAQDEKGQWIQTQDLFVAETDIMNGKKSILRVPISLTDTHPSVYSESSGNRNRIVGQPFIERDDFKFTGPSDMEVGPDPYLVDPQLTENSAVFLSDEETIFVFFKDLSGGTIVKPIIRIPGSRWSGLAFDRAGKFYFADYANGEIWVMTWTKVRELILESVLLENRDDLFNSAFLIYDQIVQPGDIEVDQGTGPFSGRTLFVSTFRGVMNMPLPIVGRFSQRPKEIKMVMGSKEEDVRIIRNTFVALPRYEDIEGQRVLMRFKFTDSNSMMDYWVSRPVILSLYGATILEGF